MIPVFASGFSWFQNIPGVADDGLVSWLPADPFGTPLAHGSASIVVHAWFAAFLVVIIAVVGRMGLERAKAREGMEKYFADDSLNARTFFELFHEATMGLLGDIMSHEDGKLYFPLIGSLFFYIFVNNILGIIPGFSPATDNVNTNVGMAIMVFIVFNWVGLSRDPVAYLKHMWGPIFLVGFLLFPIELIGLFFRPVSLSLRLTGNMFGDHLVFLVMSDLTYLVVPCAFLALAIFVSFMQSFVFALLTSIYIGMAIPHHDEDHH